jgi:hypothetical protein
MSSDGNLCTFSESLAIAKSTYGDSDPYKELDTENAAECVCYPSEKADTATISTEDCYIDRSYEILKGLQEQLNVQTYDLSAVYNFTVYNSFMHCSMKFESTEDRFVGSYIADFDNDGSQELLAAKRTEERLDFYMYEAGADIENPTCILSKSVDLGFSPCFLGSCNVSVGSDNSIYFQWRDSGAPLASGIEWCVTKISYANNEFSDAGSAYVGGSGIFDYRQLKADMSAIGLDTSYIPDEDSGDFAATADLAEKDSSLTLVTRTIETFDYSAYDWQSETNEMPGTFKVGPDIAADPNIF